MEKVVGKICCCCFKLSDEKGENIELLEEEKILEVPVEEPVLESVPEKENEQAIERSRTLWMIANKRIQTQV